MNNTTDSDHDLLIRIDERLESFVNDIEEIKNEVKDVSDTHEKRISKLENWRSYTAGAVGLISLFLFGVMVT